MRKILLVGLVGVMALTVRRAHADDNDDLRPDVLACEEALKHLVDCCDGFDAKAVTCTYYFHTSGCDSYHEASESPTYSEDESACIVATDCEPLRATGVCQRAQTAVAPSSSCDADEGDESSCASHGGVGADYEETTRKGPVCP